MAESGRQRVLVLYGGRSAEHAISILSARFIVGSLDRQRFEPLLVGIDREGRWHLQREDQLPSGDDPRNLRVASGPRAWLAPMPSGSIHSPAGAGRLTIEPDREAPFDVAFPVLHGPLGEDGAMQGLFELANIPYVGAGVAASALGMDKQLQKMVLAQADVPVVEHLSLGRHDWQRDRRAALLRCQDLGGYPLFVKPANMGSSLGITKVNRTEELEPAIERALELDAKLVIERGLEGARELEVSVLGNDELEVSLPGEIVVTHADGFYSFEAKYVDSAGARLEVPANLAPQELEKVQGLAAQAFRALDCAGIARVDLFMTRDGVLYLNEINTIPGFTAISMVPRLWQASGLAAHQLVTRLIELALERHRERS